MMRSRTAMAAWLAALGATIGWCDTARASKLLTFDDIYGVASEMPIYSGYGGLDWQNVEVMNLDWWRSDGGPDNGYVRGATSGSQVAWVPSTGVSSTTSAVLSSSTPFAFTSAQLTSAWNDGLTVQVDGYLKGQLVGSRTFVLDPDAPTLADLGFDAVDVVRLTASGGTIDPAFAPRDGSPQLPTPNFVIDDVRLGSDGSQPTDPPPVPEPSTLAFAGLVAAGWWIRSRRRPA